MEIPPPEARAEIPPERVHYYQSHVEALLSHYGREFTPFVAGLDELVAIGDGLLGNRQATGYNILRSEQDMALSSTDGLLFYSNYIGRARHFGVLLAEMEHAQVIRSEEVRFGVKASRVLYGGWNIDPQDEYVAVIHVGDEQGNPVAQEVSQTVEAVVTFAPEDGDQALTIAAHLQQRAASSRSGAIEGSWDVPDIRATAVLRGVLQYVAFAEVTANILSVGDAQLVVARQRTSFAEPWRGIPIEMNEELATYLSLFGVPA